MSASLVGSEMCIRDRARGRRRPCSRGRRKTPPEQGHGASSPSRRLPKTVSYTHLTLPTICSV
eukprot:15172992-Alexandrium_andersonii.AAC.1